LLVPEFKKEEVFVAAVVEKFPGHIACSSLSKSEIVVPLINEGQVWGVLDVDSSEYNQFDEIDQLYLEQIVALLKID
jgi:L-methionine (R)-S-oxide reductase